jgi:voltage-gated potassium channel
MLRPRRLQGIVRVVVILTLMVTLYYVLPFGRNGLGRFQLADVTVAIVGIGGLAALVTLQARALLGASGQQVKLENLAILLAVIVLFFSVLYLQLAEQFAGLSSKTDALYFTMATIGTVGYGDVHATGQTARLLVTIQMAFDLVYVAALANVFAGAARARAARLREQQLRDSGELGEAGPPAGAAPAEPT